MDNTELNPLLPSKSATTSSSTSCRRREALLREECDVVSFRLIDDWLDGAYWMPDDVNDFVSFCRMVREVERVQSELEDKYFPGRRETRDAEDGTARETRDEETQRYRQLYVALMRREAEREVFSFKKLFLGCFGFARNRKEDD